MAAMPTQVNGTFVRTVVVDDGDPRIVWTGPWEEYRRNFREESPSEPVYRDSQHRLLGGRGSMTFTFNGTGQLGVYGTTTDGGPGDPSHNCTLDGVSIDTDFAWTAPQLVDNGVRLCRVDLEDLDVGEHVLSLTAYSGEFPLYIDRIQYVPDPASPPANATVNIEGPMADEGVFGFQNTSYIARHYQSPYENLSQREKENGSFVHIRFTGTSATYVGNVPADFPPENGTGRWFLDGDQIGVPFSVPVDNITLYNQPFIHIGVLDPGKHQLFVIHHERSAYKLFKYLQVDNGDIIMSRWDDPPPRKTPIGRIVGGSVGGAVGGILVILALFVLWKRRRSTKAL